MQKCENRRVPEALVFDTSSHSKSGVVSSQGFDFTKFGKIDVSGGITNSSVELHALHAQTRLRLTARGYSRMTRHFDRVHASLHSDNPHRRDRGGLKKEG